MTTATKFHLSLNVTDLGRALAFYRALFGAEPTKCHDDYAKFDLDDPPLVLALVPSPQLPGGTLNHLGLRVADAAALVAVQRRLEENGVATERQEGVECCYARQTKFWVSDPDRNLWEVYTLHEDLGHSGFEDPPAARAAPDAQASRIWQHRLTEPPPERIEHPDGALDEVWLEGTFNADLDDARLGRLLAEARRVLRPGGRIVVHGLASDRPFPGKPDLPGMAALVRRVPTDAAVLDALRRAGFVYGYFDKLGDIHCFQVGGVELRELRLAAWSPGAPQAGRERELLYKGPLAYLTDEGGARFRRGERVRVPAVVWERLRAGPVAGQFVFFSG